MKLNQALTKLRNLKSKISRIEICIDESAVFYEDETPDYSYEDELVKRNALVTEIRDLKTSIQKTNASTTVIFNGESKTITELILINADLRSEMAFINRQLQHSTDGNDFYSRRGGPRTKETVKKVLANGCDKSSFQNVLNSLESTKENLEEVLGNANSSTDLV